MMTYFQQMTGGNWIDLTLMAVMFYFMLTNKGFMHGALELCGFFFSLFFSYEFYFFFGGFLIDYLFFPNGIANALGFFIAWLISEAIFYLLAIIFIWRLLVDIKEHPLNRVLGYVVASLQAVFLYLFVISLVFLLPVKGQIKKEILQSRTGPFFINLSQSFEKQVKNVFGEAVSETINFLTIRPNSDQTVGLGFKLPSHDLKVDMQSEMIMEDLVNKERETSGLGKLITDENLKAVARDYAKEMMVNGFFAHVSEVDQSTVVERVKRRSIAPYLIIGENLAFAPDVYIAHQGLMNSQGHRENILHSEYGRVGIGVMDGGVYGRMFVQVFAD